MPRFAMFLEIAAYVLAVVFAVVYEPRFLIAELAAALWVVSR